MNGFEDYKPSSFSLAGRSPNECRLPSGVRIGQHVALPGVGSAGSQVTRGAALGTCSDS